MQNRSLHQRIWHIAWPMMASNISIPLLGLVDTALLGHLESALYLGAVAVGMSVITLFYWAFSFLRMGTTLFTAQHVGALEHSDQQIERSLAKIMAQSCLLGALCGLTLLTLGPLISPTLLQWMGAEPGALELAEEYIQIRLLAAPAVFISYAITGWLIGSQQTRWALALVLTANSLNIVLD
ncbi:MATE family efflux transporter, partial [bacterium]|nr:MATE family efflux transporter [bacterium]